MLEKAIKKLRHMEAECASILKEKNRVAQLYEEMEEKHMLANEMLLATESSNTENELQVRDLMKTIIEDSTEHEKALDELQESSERELAAKQATVEELHACVETLTATIAKARSEHDSHMAEVTAMSERKIRECREANADAQSKLVAFMSKMENEQRQHEGEIRRMKEAYERGAKASAEKAAVREKALHGLLVLGNDLERHVIALKQQLAASEASRIFTATRLEASQRQNQRRDPKRDKKPIIALSHLTRDHRVGSHRRWNPTHKANSPRTGSIDSSAASSPVNSRPGTPTQGPTLPPAPTANGDAGVVADGTTSVELLAG